ncbi:hypothetical protein TNCV_3378671 [Trichonephila clavipes]|nr:hypothetical protein TNCV_3378671 [Trichonephila clavipes]
MNPSFVYSINMVEFLFGGFVSACIFYCLTGPSPGLLICGAIEYTSRSALVIIDGSLNGAEHFAFLSELSPSQYGGYDLLLVTEWVRVRLPTSNPLTRLVENEERWESSDHPRLFFKIEIEPTENVLSPAWCSKLWLTTVGQLITRPEDFRDLPYSTVNQVA